MIKAGKVLDPQQSGVMEIAARDYWLDQFRRAAAPRLDVVKSEDFCEVEIRLEPPLLADVNRICGNDLEIRLVLAASALAILAERYTCAESVLLATSGIHREKRKGEESPLFFSCATEPQVTPRNLVEELSLQIPEMERYAQYDLSRVRRKFLEESPASTGDLVSWGIAIDRLQGMGQWQQELDLWIEWRSGGTGLKIAARSRYQESLTQRLLRHYVAALRGVITHPDNALNSIEILDEADVKRLVVDYNPAQRPVPGLSLAALFEEQARRQPEALALIDAGSTGEERRWSYDQLNRSANALARHLADNFKLGAEEIVPILLGRSSAAIVSILAVLKAGGTYAPIDLDSPKDRIKALLSDLGARLVIAGDAYAPFCNGMRILNADAWFAQEFYESKSADPVGAQAASLAYVMYTSGSTGRPKGVMVEQQAVTRLVRNTNYIELGPRDRWLQAASLAFDASTLEIWSALLNGGSLVLAPSEDLLDSAKLKALIRRYGITNLWITTGWFHQLVDTDVAILEPLKRVLTGGERISRRHVEKVRRALPNLLLTNAYGPTENTVFSTCHAIDNVEPNEELPIGRSIANTNTVILDAHGRLAPEGASGELCVGGMGLARGYWKAPEQTALRFIPDPFASGQRLYRTGDRALWREDGLLAFLGRMDNQVKLRGFRIDPGEVEAALVKHSSLAQAVVGVQGEQLVAWVVPRNGRDASGLSAELREHVGRILPLWMAPARYVILDSLPLNRSGKVDQAALQILPDDRREFTPRTPMEAGISAVWEEVLGLTNVGIDENFFEIGGHSLKAIALKSKLGQRLGLEISFRDLFLHPTIKQLAELGEKRGVWKREAIPVLEPADYYPVSSAQRRLWILDQLDPGGVAYNMPTCFTIEGALSIEALDAAIQGVVQRHAILRTRFGRIEGEPIQIVEVWTSKLEVKDLSDQPEPLAGLRLEMIAEAARPFALDQLPLFRCRLYRLGPGWHALALHLHHIVGDGVSSEILLEELSELYAASVEGRESRLPPLRIQYSDVAAWQNAQLESGALDGHRKFWIERLTPPLPIANVPSDFPRPPIQTFDGGTISFSLGPERSRSFEGLRRRVGAEHTPFTLFLTFVFVWLHRVSGQEDLIVGSPVTGRGHEELLNQVGFYVNTLPLRQTVLPGQSFGSLLAGVHNLVMDAHDHQAYPFDRLVEELDVPRDISRGAIFDVFVTYQEKAEFDLSLAGLVTNTFRFPDSISKFDLSFYFARSDDGLVLSVEFNRRLFLPDSIRRFASQVFASIDNVAQWEKAEDGLIGDIELLDVAERQRILSGFNSTARLYEAEDNVVSLFEAQVARTPHRVALQFQERSLSYSELNARANAAAGLLRRELGITARDLVAVFCDRGVDAIAVILGVLKCGAAYVPVDPSYPPARIRYMFEDSRARVVVTDAQNVEMVDSLGLRAVVLDQAGDPEAPNPRCIPSAHHPAYVIYTSGSTGQPKGVAIQHGAAAQFLHWCREEFDGEPPTVTAGTSLCFDLSIFEIFYPLTVGGRVRLLNSGMEIRDWLTQEDRILINTVPSVVKDLVSGGADLSRVSVLNMAGEPIPLSLIEHLQENYPDCVIRNLYGPSEDTTYSTCFRFPRHARRVLIGQPVANTRAYILDGRFHPVPIGVAGELYLSSSKLAAGYLNRPTLTAEKFLADPVQSGRRMYRTQDLARWTAEGEIEFLGRTDDQVKIRGYRIEPGEIQHALRAHPHVSDAVVVDGSDNLAAFLTLSHPASEEELRRFLGMNLPAFMVPAQFVFMSEFPLSANGKVDRAALVQNLQTRLPGASLVGPRDELERKLLCMWKAVLEKDEFGVTDNFFSLGGQSLKATRLLAMVSSETGIAMPLKIFFTNATVAGQALWLREQRAGVTGDIPTAPVAEHYPLSPAQLRMWILADLEPQSRAYHIPAVFRITGPLDIPSLESALLQVVNRHESLRTRFVLVDGEPRQIVDARHAVQLPVVRIDAEETEAAIARELEKTFDLAAGPLWRAALLCMDDDTHVLVLVLHHLIADGWSLNLLVKEWIASYSCGESLHPLSVQYKDYAAWLNHRIARGDLQGEKEYWRRKLAGPPPVLDLPADFSRPLFQEHKGGEIRFALELNLALRWQEFCRRHKATLFSGLLAVFQELLFRYSGQQDFAVGTPVSGRVHAQLHDLVGLFINTLALRCTPRSGQNSPERLAESQLLVEDAIEHQLYPFERLVDELEIPRDPGRSAVFDVMLVVEQDQVMPSFPGLLFEELPPAETPSKFDLSLYATEREGAISFRLVYNRALFYPSRMERMARHFQNLLAGVAADTQSPIEKIDILDSSERTQLIKEFNCSQWPRVAGTPVERFEYFALTAPDHPAVEFGSVKLSYRDLNIRANSLASRLKQLASAGPGSRVAVLLHPDERLPEALLAVWKTGAAYVPVDPGNPPERIRLVLENSGVQVVITSESASGVLKGMSLDDVSLVVLGQESLTRVDENPQRVCDNESPAYVIYTSGTTGVPKGAIQPNRALSNYVAWLGRAFEIGSRDRSGLLSSYAFDLGYTSLWGTLLNGGKLALPPFDAVREPELLIEWVVSSRLSYLKATPSLFEMLLNSPSSDRLAESSLRLILLGGELLRSADVRRFLQIRPETRVANHYGPTETTVGSIVGVLDPEQLELKGPVLGRPIDNTRVYIVDAARRLSPIGVPGEIWIGGEGVGLGYVGGREPDRFCDDPWHKGGKIYRTGDRGCWTDDGRIRFLGRTDHQVKIRGYRVEPAEIEMRLRQFEGVNAATVVSRQTDSGQSELMACIASPGNLDLSELRDFLGARLPGYMIPSLYVVLPELPLTGNGKLDIEALRKAAALEPQRLRVGPRSELESRMLELWREVLQCRDAGVTDDFFLCGGHSLRAISLLSRIRRETGAVISLREFFSAPTIEALAANVLRYSSQTQAASDTVPRIPDADSYELSSAQMRLWVLQHIDPQGLAYSMPSGFMLDGPFDVERLQRALNRVVARHEILRTTFVAQEGHPRQRVGKEQPISIKFLDLSREVSPLQTALSLQKQDACVPFALESGPLLRLHLLQIGTERFVFLLNMHHIISDGWSLGVLAHELFSLYGSNLQAELKPLQLQYRDVAAWQNRLFADNDGSRRYWLQKLAAPREVLELPADHPRPSLQNFSGDRVAFRFPASVRENAIKVAGSLDATLFMVLAAGVKALLLRYSGKRDIAIGTAVAGRTRLEFEDAIGPFVQTLVLRDVVDPGSEFSALLAQVRNTTLEALDHQGYPFDQLVDELGLARDLSRNPLFDVMIVLQNAAPVPESMNGVEIRVLDSPGGSSKFDLNFIFTEDAQGLRLDLEYAIDLFQRDRIERLCNHLCVLLQAAVSRPRQPISALTLLTEEEQAQFTRISRGAIHPLSDLTLADRFEAQAKKTPDAVALDFATGSLTYAELNERANRAAWLLLQRYKVHPEDVVALLLPRSPQLIVAMLAVLKAGAAYLPLDPEHPLARLEALSEHARLVLCDGDFRLPRSENIFHSDESTAAHAPGNPPRSAAQNNLAYVLFTSGSTGRPKGCMIEHQSIHNYVDWASRTYGQGRVVYGLHSPITFDLTLTSIFCPLLTGGTLYIYPPEMRADEMLRHSFDSATAINVVKLTPSHVLMLEHLWLGPSNVELAVLGGEAVTAEHVRILRALNPKMRIVNEYGPTETTVGSSWYEAGSFESGSLSIGAPIQNTQIFILDEWLQPAPAGVTGEICIAGQGVARGYLADPELTERKFVSIPALDGCRVYRTGDLGRWNPNGGFEYLGRRDDQVKLRGHRIELNEIEECLQQCSGVSRAVAGVRRNSAGSEYLLAWIVADPEVAWNESGVTAQLATLLPGYMIPARLLQVSSIPTTANGKLNREALPDPEVFDETRFEEPSEARGKILAEVWAEVLGKERIGIHDNFFHLGGDSIRAVQMSYVLRERGWSLEVRRLFEAPTLRDAAVQMEPIRKRLVRQGSHANIPLTAIQRWFFRTQIYEWNHFNQAVLLGARENLEPAALQAVLNGLVEQHEALRLQFRRRGEEVVQSVSDPQFVPLQVIDLCSEPDWRRALLGHAAKLHQSLDVEQGRILQSALFRTTEGDRLLIIIHHLATDGYSWRILLEDLELGYEHARRGKPLRFPAPTDSFSAWAEVCVALEQSNVSDAEREWRERWEAAETCLLPGVGQPPYLGKAARRMEVWFSLDETGYLLGPALTAYSISPEDILLSALARTCRNWFGADCIRVMIEGHGRLPIEDLDVSRTVGWFTSRMSLLLDHSELDDVLLMSTKKTLRETPTSAPYRFPVSESHHDAEIGFNYLGQIDSARPGLFWIAPEDTGPSMGERSVLPQELSLVAVVVGGALLVEFIWPEGRWPEEEIRRISGTFADAVRTLLSHCMTASRQPIPSEFTYQHLSPDELESIFDGE